MRIKCHKFDWITEFLTVQSIMLRKMKRNLVTDDDSVVEIVKEMRIDRLCLYDLPDDVYSCIFSFCDLSSLGRLAISCKYTNELINRRELGAFTTATSRVVRDFFDKALEVQTWEDSHKTIDFLMDTLEKHNSRLWKTGCDQIINEYFPKSGDSGIVGLQCRFISHSNELIHFAIYNRNSCVDFRFSKTFINSTLNTSEKSILSYTLSFKNIDETDDDDSDLSDDEDGFHRLVTIEISPNKKHKRVWATSGSGMRLNLSSITHQFEIIKTGMINDIGFLELLFNICTHGRFGSFPYYIINAYTDQHTKLGNIWSLSSDTNLTDWMNGKFKGIAFTDCHMPEWNGKYDYDDSSEEDEEPIDVSSNESSEDSD